MTRRAWGKKKFDVRADIFIVNGPEAVKAQDVLIIVAYVLHLIPVLVPDTVIYCFKVHLGQVFG
jgi:hypothetical protein